VRRIPFTTRVPTITLGPHHVNRAGDGSEFHALRDYAQGDSLRTVNWKASARSGSLMVNQRVHESMTRLTLLLDARAASGAGPATATPLADGCRAAVSIAGAALRVRDRIRLVAYGEGLTEVPEAPGSRQLHELREALSCLPARGAMGLAQAVEAMATQLRPNTPVLILSGCEGDPSFVDGVRALRNRGCLPLVVASPVHVRPDGAEPEEPGAAALLAQREQTLAGVRALGVPVHETEPGLPLDDLFRLGGA
ncbi:MAG TPA: DUF58 domain-containing protein, partial [Candidatus Thermoplasmatota archaeon]|nr:DUF58 domain-containing protein [Candidatus Thermoplasmatota archaeon]